MAWPRLSMPGLRMISFADITKTVRWRATAISLTQSAVPKVSFFFKSKIINRLSYNHFIFSFSEARLLPFGPLKCTQNADCNNNMICIGEVCVSSTSCAASAYGCCDDGVTPARGRSSEGCPQVCACNPAGSLSKNCNRTTGACQCRPDVIGKLCDTCATGFWGLGKVVDPNTDGSGCKRR
jgi:hypothetical protein